MNIYLNTDRQQ